MKQNILKKIGKFLTLFVLVLLFLSSCSPSSASASTITDAIDTTTRYIDNFMDFYEDRFSEYYNFVTGYKGVWTDKTIADFNRANLDGSGELKSYPLYSFTGKVINDYFNINNSVDDVEARDINYVFLSTSTNVNPANKNPLPGFSNVVPQEFYSGEDVLQVGTLFILRTHVDLSTGEPLSAKRYALVPLDYMPNIVYYVNGNISIYFTGRFHLYVDGVLQSGTLNYSDFSITFYNNTVNSVVYRNGLSFYPNDTQFFSFSGNWNRWYITDISTNNTDFYDDYTNTLNTVYVDTPSAKPPVSLVGLPMGTVVTEETVNNYNYITYTDGTFKLDTYELGLDFDANIKPQIQLDFDNVYKSQPLPGLNFDSDILYNYLELFAVPISSDYLPAEWLDTYGQINTTPNLDIDSWLVPPTSATLPADLVSDMSKVSSTGVDLLDIFGLTAPFVALALIGVIYKFLS